MSGQLYESMRAVFKAKFVHFEPVLEALLNAWSEFEEDSNVGANLILWGRGGFGKSEMAKTFAQALELLPFVQSLGASSSEEAIWGELNLKELRDGDAIQFHLKRSFLVHQFVILEEALDLPERILDDMKDTLSARCFRRGFVQEPMQTRTLVVCTNRDPQQYRKRNTSTDAFIQRFPLEVKVEWPSYDAKDYRMMYERQLPQYADLAPLFANIMAGISAAQTSPPPAPREALDAMRTVVRQAIARGRKVVVAADFDALLRMTAFGRQREMLKGLIDDAMQHCGNHIKLNGCRHEAQQLIAKLQALDPKSKGKAMDSYVSLTAELEQIQQRTNALRIAPEDGGFERKQDLLRQISRALRA